MKYTQYLQERENDPWIRMCSPTTWRCYKNRFKGAEWAIAFLKKDIDKTVCKKWKTKINKDDYSEIWELVTGGTFTKDEIALKYWVSRRTIHRIVNDYVDNNKLAQKIIN